MHRLLSLGKKGVPSNGGLFLTSAEMAVAAVRDVFSLIRGHSTVGLPLRTAREYGFTHITSIPRYLQVNKEAEPAVATVKDLW